METKNIHSIVNFDPAEYEYVGPIYLGDLWHVLSLMGAKEADSAMDTLQSHPERLYDGSFKNKGICDHCGAHFIWGAMYYHKITSTYIVVGWQCSAKEFGYNSRLDYDIERFKKRLEKYKKDEEMKLVVDKFLAERPYLVEPLKLNHPIINDIRFRLNQWGTISDKQVQLVVKLAAEVGTRKPVIEGESILVEGIVMSCKYAETPWGTKKKMLVKDDRCFYIYGNCPTGHVFEQGTKVKFTAKVTKSGNDSTFGFFSGAKMVEGEVHGK